MLWIYFSYSGDLFFGFVLDLIFVTFFVLLPEIDFVVGVNFTLELDLL